MYIIFIILAVIAAVIGIIIFTIKKGGCPEVVCSTTDSYYEEDCTSKAHGPLSVLIALNITSLIIAVLTIIIVSCVTSNYELLLKLIYVVPVGIASIAVPIAVQKRLDEKHAHETSMQESLYKLANKSDHKDTKQ